MKILDVRIDNLDKEETLKKVSEFLNTPGQKKIFTPNPEMLVDAQKDEYFKQVLNSGDLNVCDGFGIVLASKLLRHPRENGDLISPNKDSRVRGNDVLIERYQGVELMLDICKLAAEQGRNVYLLGSGNKEVVEKTKEELKNKFPNLKIVGCQSGPKLQVTSYKLQVDNDVNDEVIHNIILTAPDILFIAFGHNKQEKWIAENLKDLPSVKIAMGVGGAFDFISGYTKRAPLLMRKIGLEWMWRLLLEPRRFRRIFNATVIFTYYFIKSVIGK